MRSTVYTLLAVVLCISITWVLCVNGGMLDADGANRWLVIAGFIVTVSALSQVVFAVIAYLEATMLRAQINELRKAAEDGHRVQLNEISLVKDLYFEATKHLISGMMDAAFELPDEKQFSLQRKMKSMQIQADLAHGSAFSLQRAMHAVYQHDKEAFPAFSERLFERASALSREEESLVKKSYYELLRLSVKRAKI